ncbi:hypothetical protein PP653_gp038 [Bacillus phage Basilisk]|uniref:Uncharacterized protein n=1 Tax=Bacillus phage Basilisk TaxID=1296654 RepID=S5MSD2_9CAUD|nr:hypothetical protein PP653_gp038 [Bacillus phage Basilisk]AGR46712.1 hypothetical protein BASILISK_129 [Bacillus phage Basilisk]
MRKINMYIANVYFTKTATADNFHNGCAYESQLIHEEKFTVEFNDTEDLKEKLADYTTKHFDVWHNDFIEYVTNETENNRFDYQQNECEDARKLTLTEEYPDGFLCDYSFTITKVSQETEYKF